MDTNTIDQNSISDARSSLMSSLNQATDFSQFKDSSASEPVSSPADATLNNPPSDSRSESDASEQVTNQTPSQPAKEGATNTSNEVATNPTDTQTPAPKARAPGRIQELLELNKVKEAKVQELEKRLQEASKSKEPVKEAAPEHLIPQPEAPKYSKELLSQLLAKAKESGDQGLFDNVQAQFEEWRAHELKMIEWKIDHKEAITRHNSNVEFYKQEALKQVPELKDPNSPVTQQYMGVRGWINKEMPELLKKPVSEYLLASIARWKHGDETKSARLVATETELKKAKEEIEKLKKGSLPLDSKTRTEVSGNSSPDSSLSDAKSKLMQSLKEAQLGFGAQTM